METLYRFVKASERLPEVAGEYIIRYKDERSDPRNVCSNQFDGVDFEFRKMVIEWLEALPQSPSTLKEEDWPVQCELDEQQCQQECKHKSNRIECPFASSLPYKKEFHEYFKKYYPHLISPEPVDREAVEGYVKSVSVQNKELIDKIAESKKENDKLVIINFNQLQEIKRLKEIAEDAYIVGRNFKMYSGSEVYWHDFKTENNL